jgi:hypothetical protein
MRESSGRDRNAGVSYFAWFHGKADVASSPRPSPSPDRRDTDIHSAQGVTDRYYETPIFRDMA